MEIYLRHRELRGWYRIACDEDTKYYLFDDACEPVGRTADAKDEWEPITKEEYELRPRGTPKTFDPTVGFMDALLLRRATYGSGR